MKLNYDADARAMYIELADRSGGVARTVEIDDGTNADLDPEGSLLGIEVPDPGRHWPLAEILAQWNVSPVDAGILMAAYPCPFPVQVA
jgi:uncharacterized protein YuzE